MADTGAESPEKGRTTATRANDEDRDAKNKRRHADDGDAVNGNAQPSKQARKSRVQESKEESSENPAALESETDAFGRILWRQRTSASRSRSPSVESESEKGRKRGRHASRSRSASATKVESRSDDNPRRSAPNEVRRSRSPRDRYGPRRYNGRPNDSRGRGGYGRDSYRDDPRTHGRYGSYDRGMPSRGGTPPPSKRARNDDYERHYADYNEYPEAESYAYGYGPSPMAPPPTRQNYAKPPPRSSESGHPSRGAPLLPRPTANIENGPMMTYKEFLLTEADDITPEVGQMKYATYKQTYEEKSLARFFEVHAKEDWFQERYRPSVMVQVFTESAKRAQEEYTAFVNDYRQGRRDFVDRDIRGPAEATPSVEENPEDIEEGAVPSDTPVKSDKPASAPKKESATPVTVKQEGTTIFVGTIPSIVSRSQLQQLFTPLPGFKRLSYSAASAFKYYGRVVWATFNTVEDAQNALKQEPKQIGSITIRLREKKNISRRITRRAPPVCLTPTRIAKDLEQALQLMGILDQEKGLSSNFLTNDADPDSLSHVANPLARLNIVIEYLRRVHIFCYYCGREYLNEEDMYAQCGPVHERDHGKVESSDKASVDTTTVQETGESDTTSNNKDPMAVVDERIAKRCASHPFGSFMEPESEREAKKEEQIRPFCDQNTTELEPSKFRCQLCSKLFKGAIFVHKHISNRHADAVTEFVRKSEETVFKNNFLNDPESKILVQHDMESRMTRSSAGSIRYSGSRPSFGGPAMGAYGAGPAYDTPPAWGRGSRYSYGGAPRPAPYTAPHASFPQRDYGYGDMGGPSPASGGRGRGDRPRPMRSYNDLDNLPAQNIVIDYGFGLLPPPKQRAPQGAPAEHKPDSVA